MRVFDWQKYQTFVTSDLLSNRTIRQLSCVHKKILKHPNHLNKQHLQLNKIICIPLPLAACDKAHKTHIGWVVQRILRTNCNKHTIKNGVQQISMCKNSYLIPTHVNYERQIMRRSSCKWVGTIGWFAHNPRKLMHNRLSYVNISSKKMFLAIKVCLTREDTYVERYLIWREINYFDIILYKV